MKATINNQNVTANTLDELRAKVEKIARTMKDPPHWVYGEDEKGQFGFCTDLECNCNKFVRYNK